MFGGIIDLGGRVFLLIAIVSIITIMVSLVSSIMSQVFVFFITINDKNITELLPFFEPFYNTILIIAFSIFLLIAFWQTFKTMFSYLGFEVVEEPIKLFMRIIVFGFLTFYAKDILFLVINSLFEPIMGVMEKFSDKGFNVFFNLSGNLVVSLRTLDVLRFIIYIYLLFRFIGVTTTFVKRILITIVLIIFSPLAFASGVSKSTQQFFSSFIKFFLSAIFAQMFQVLLVVIIIPLVETQYFNLSTKTSDLLIGFVLLSAAIEITNGIEGILGQVSFSSVAGNTSTAFISNYISFTQSIENVRGLSKGIFPSGHDASTIASRSPSSGPDQCPDSTSDSNISNDNQ